MKGLRISGKAKTLTDKDTEYEEILESYKKNKQEKERELRSILQGWQSMEIIQVKAESMEYLDSSLATKGFAIKQT